MEERLYRKLSHSDKENRGWTGPSTYLLANLPRIRTVFSLPTEKSKKVPSNFSLQKTEHIGKRVRGLIESLSHVQAEYRPDIPDLILRERRKFIVDQLVYLSGLMRMINPMNDAPTSPSVSSAQIEGMLTTRKKGQEKSRPLSKSRRYIVSIQDWKDVSNIEHRGCILWLPLSNELKSRLYATFDIPSANLDKKIPVHNLRHILGCEHIELLRTKCELFRSGELWVLTKGRTREIQSELWKMHAYLWDSMEESINFPGGHEPIKKESI